jgi:hypothetical protein
MILQKTYSLQHIICQDFLIHEKSSHHSRAIPFIVKDLTVVRSTDFAPVNSRPIFIVFSLRCW